MFLGPISQNLDRGQSSTLLLNQRPYFKELSQNFSDDLANHRPEGRSVLKLEEHPLKVSNNRSSQMNLGAVSSPNKPNKRPNDSLLDVVFVHKEEDQHFCDIFGPLMSLSSEPLIKKRRAAQSPRDAASVMPLAFDSGKECYSEVIFDDSPITPSKFHESNEYFFDVQTPSKELSLSERQDFHLVSPPGGFPQIADPPSPKPLGDLRPRALFQSDDPKSRRLPFIRSNCTTKITTAPAQSISSRSSASSTTTFVPMNATGSLVRRFSATPQIPCKVTRPSLQVCYNLNKPKTSPNDSIALSMAKMTVWNRLTAARPPLKVEKPHYVIPVNMPQQVVATPQRPPLPTPSYKLPYPVKREPEFTIRRVVQSSKLRRWRRFALGENRHYQSAVQAAQRFLNASSERSF